MQYCKSCGKQLEDGARFCPRCGKSVRQSKNSEREKKQNQIKKLQKERIERKKLREEREAEDRERKARKTEVRKRQNRIIMIACVCIAAVIIIAVASYIVTSNSSKDESWRNTPIGSLDTTAVPTMQPANTISPVSDTPAPSGNTYSAYILSNDISFSYPDTFTEADIQGDEELRFEDENGAVAEVYMTEYPGGTPEGLMRRYAEGLDGTTNYSLTGNDWYVITVQHGDIVTHRKYIIDRENDLSVYYDLEYDVTMGDPEQYEDYMDHMDAKFAPVKADKNSRSSSDSEEADEESD